MIKPWEKIRSKPAGDFRIFTIRTDTKRSPRTGHEHDVHVIDSVNWVNVIAVTPDDHLVMVEQYRHGSNTVELEIPGGMMDAGDGSPVETAVRELREELGIEVLAAEPVIAYAHQYADRNVFLHLWHVTRYEGTPNSAEGQAIKWVALDDLDKVGLLEADTPMIEPLKKALGSRR